jgi:hypothetical protein
MCLCEFNSIQFFSQQPVMSVNLTHSGSEVKVNEGHSWSSRARRCVFAACISQHRRGDAAVTTSSKPSVAHKNASLVSTCYTPHLQGLAGCSTCLLGPRLGWKVAGHSCRGTMCPVGSGTYRVTCSDPEVVCISYSLLNVMCTGKAKDWKCLVNGLSDRLLQLVTCVHFLLTASPTGMSSTRQEFVCVHP